MGADVCEVSKHLFTPCPAFGDGVEEQLADAVGLMTSYKRFGLEPVICMLCGQRAARVWFGRKRNVRFVLYSVSDGGVVTNIELLESTE